MIWCHGEAETLCFQRRRITDDQDILAFPVGDDMALAIELPCRVAVVGSGPYPTAAGEWRSGRIGSTSGSVTAGHGRFLELRGATRS